MSHQTMWRAAMANEREKQRHEQEMQKMWEKVRTTRCHSKREFDKLWKEYAKMLACAYVYKLHGFTRNDPTREERERLKRENLEMFEKCYEKHSRTKSNSPVSRRAKTPRTRSESPRAERRPNRQASSDEGSDIKNGIKGFDKLFPAIVNKKKDQKPKILGLKGKGVPPPTIRPHSEISLSASKRQAVEINQNFQKILVERQSTSVEVLHKDSCTPEPSDETFRIESPEDTDSSRFPEIPRQWSLVHRSDTLPVDPDSGAIILGHYSDQTKNSAIDPKMEKVEIENNTTNEKGEDSSKRETETKNQTAGSNSRKEGNVTSSQPLERKDNGDQGQKEGGSDMLKSKINEGSKAIEMKSLKSESPQGIRDPELPDSLGHLSTNGIRVELVQKSRTSIISTQIDTSKREKNSNPNVYNKNTTLEEQPLPVSNTVSLMIASLKQKQLPNRNAHSEPTWRLRYMMKLRQQDQKTNRGSLSPIPERPKSVIPHEYNSKVRRRRFMEQEVDRVMREWDPATHRAREAQKLLQLSREKTQIDIARLKAAMVKDFRVCIEGHRPKFPPIHDKYQKKPH